MCAGCGGCRAVCVGYTSNVVILRQICVRFWVLGPPPPPRVEARGVEACLPMMLLGVQHCCRAESVAGSWSPAAAMIASAMATTSGVLGKACTMDTQTCHVFKTCSQQKRQLDVVLLYRGGHRQPILIVLFWQDGHYCVYNPIIVPSPVQSNACIALPCQSLCLAMLVFIRSFILNMC